MKIVKALTNRITIVGLALVLQLAVVAHAAGMFETKIPAMEVTVRIISLVAVCLVVNERADISIKLTWVIFILVTPVFASVIYFLTSVKAPKRRVRRTMSRAENENKKYRPTDRDAEMGLKAYDEGLYVQSRYLKSIGFPVLENTQGVYYSSGEEAFPEMLREIEKAKKFIFAEYFIFDKGEMMDAFISALEKKAKEGVDVRLIYDDMGSLFTLPYKYNEELEKKGIKCIVFNRFAPFLSTMMNNRDHRKILAIDSRVAFTGGINIADEYINKKNKYGYWKDNVVMVKGEGAVMFSIMFLDMWHALSGKSENISPLIRKWDYPSDGWVQPFCDTPMDNEVLGANVYINAISNAKKYIYIFTPYLIPNEQIVSALCLAAKKGVDVRIVIPGIPDKKSVYLITRAYCTPLIRDGVKIYKMTSGFVHSKGFVCDDAVACVGTINLDFRSLHHHFECGCMFYHSRVVADVKNDILKTIAKCERISRTAKIKGLISGAYYAILRIVAPLM